MVLTALALREAFGVRSTPACSHWFLAQMPESLRHGVGEERPSRKDCIFGPGFTWLRKLFDI